MLDKCKKVYAIKKRDFGVNDVVIICIFDTKELAIEYILKETEKELLENKDNEKWSFNAALLIEEIDFYY